MPITMKRAAYADMFGPTTGDRVRLADTDLIVEVEKDFTVYGFRQEVMGPLKRAVGRPKPAHRAQTPVRKK